MKNLVNGEKTVSMAGHGAQRVRGAEEVDRSLWGLPHMPNTVDNSVYGRQWGIKSLGKQQ